MFGSEQCRQHANENYPKHWTINVSGHSVLDTVGHRQSFTKRSSMSNAITDIEIFSLTIINYHGKVFNFHRPTCYRYRQTYNLVEFQNLLRKCKNWNFHNFINTRLINKFITLKYYSNKTPNRLLNILVKFIFIVSWKLKTFIFNSFKNFLHTCVPITF